MHTWEKIYQSKISKLVKLVIDRDIKVLITKNATMKYKIFTHKNYCPFFEL